MASANPAPQRRILVINEDPVVRIAVRYMLEQNGYEVVDASSCDTITEGTDLDFDGVLLDVQEIDETCFALLRATRALPVTAPVLLTADYGAVLPSGLALDYGTVSLLTKPFSADSLEQRVRSLVAKG